MARGLSELPNRLQAVILAALAALLAGAAFWYLVWPLSARSDSLKKQVNDLHEQNTRNRAFEQEHAMYLRRIQEADKELETLRSIVPDEPMMDDFVKMIHESESGAGIRLRSFVAQPLVNQDLYTETPFKVRLDGTYYALVDFFARLARGQRIVNVTDLDLEVPQSGGGLGVFKVQPGETVGASCLTTTYFNRSSGAAAQVKK